MCAPGKFKSLAAARKSIMAGLIQAVAFTENLIMILGKVVGKGGGGGDVEASILSVHYD